jgi:tetratricopeptide (TPR) repeat protein
VKPPPTVPAVRPAGTIKLSISSAQPATIFIDGAEYGSAPVVTYVRPGAHRIEAQPHAPDLLKQSRTIYAQKDQAVAFDSWKKDLLGKALGLIAQYRKTRSAVPLEQALALLDEIVKAFPRISEPPVADRQNYLRACYQLGLLYSYEKKDPDTAESYFNKVLELDPTSPTVLYEKGYILFKKKLWSEALRNFEQALRNVNVYPLQPDQRKRLVLGSTFYQAVCKDLLYKRQKDMDSLIAAKTAYESYLMKSEEYREKDDQGNVAFAERRVGELSNDLRMMTLGGEDGQRTRMFQ